MHRPETWGYLQFSIAKAGTAKFAPDATAEARFILDRILYAQRTFRLEHQHWARNFIELIVPSFENGNAISDSREIWLTADQHCGAIHAQVASRSEYQ